jgi:hypothetical protein
MPISSNQKLDKIVSSLILNQASIIQKISGFSSTSDNVFLIDSFENYNPAISGLYISNKETDGIHEIRYYDNDEGWFSFVKPTSNIINNNSTNLTVPTSKSVYDLMNSISGKISGNVDESILDDYALKSDLDNVKEVHFINTRFGNSFNALVSGIYIDIIGETRFFHEPGTSYTNISYPVNNIITNENGITIPTTNAVFNFVKNISGNFTESLKNVVFKSDLDSVKEIHYLNTYFGDNFSASASGIYIDAIGEVRFYQSIGVSYTNISYPLCDNIVNEETKTTLPTTNAVFNFVNNEKNIVKSIDGSFDKFTPNTNGIYIDETNEIRFYDEKGKKTLSMEVVDDLRDKENISTEKVASTFAIVNYIRLLEDRISELESKINQ